ncbi:protein kinase domain-containing protein [Streptomyces sp. TR02-1]|uniref:protein kinase domain-containing protein n=1 Tax=Streptomyces sp. TR02-1 TaxID=3385977 RepID=UPI0039A0336F
MQRIGRYVVERELGRGDTGTVHLARTPAGRAVAVKVLHPRAQQDTAGPDGARAAVDAARRVGGFHTAPVLDAGTESGAVWFATAYEPAPSLATMLESHGPLDETGLRRLGTGVADALRSVHACGLVHGALKPSDVLMADDGPRVRDFGLRGTIGEGEPTGAAEDVRQLGALLLAAGGGALARLPHTLRSVVESCLEDEATARPAVDELLEVLRNGPPAAAPPAPAHAPGHPAGAGPYPADPYGPGPHGPAAPPVPGQAPAPQGGFGPPPATAPVPPPAPAPAPVAPPGHPVAGPPGPGEPEFLAMDRRNDIVADAHGISFTAQGHHTDLPWPHLRFVQHRRDAQGSTFHLTVSFVLVNGAQTACRVSTRNPGEVEQWAAQLDAVLSRFLPPPQ